MFDDTITAIATPLGEGGLAVIRLSGDAALAIAEPVSGPPANRSLRPPPLRPIPIHYGKIVRQEWSH